MRSTDCRSVFLATLSAYIRGSGSAYRNSCSRVKRRGMVKLQAPQSPASMPPIFCTRAQTQHPCGQIELERERDGCFARFFLIYSTVSVTTQAKRMNSHRDMNPTRRGLRWLVHMLHLIGREDSRRGPAITRKRHTAPASFVPADACPPLDVSLIGRLALAGPVSRFRCRAG